MRLGLLADIHEDVEHLRRALQVLQSRRIDRIVFLGDLCRMCLRIDETAGLLADAGAVGVWGNHDFGLCQKSDAELVDTYSPESLRFMRSLSPRLELDGCLFTHVEPWLDPHELHDLWWFEGVPDTPARLAQTFDSLAHRAMFVGHFHRWFAGTRAGLLDWTGESPLTLQPDERYLIGVNAVCEGRCALFDTETRQLEPIELDS